ncbi:MAG: aspartate ammonia-lyase [Deltaproteobacteria bacterium]|nr:aspartate ammonia-lyase [Deltaproteobacteria bacterium]
MEYRIEKDSLGEKRVPKDVYYGIQTLRAVENFPISGFKPFPEFVTAFVYIKKTAALVNTDLGLLDSKISKAIVQAADEILNGKHRDQFVVDVFQAGAGTSHNMNTNEVLCNRAIEILGGKRGNYSVVHPNDHVNMAQSTNDTFPTAMRLSTLMRHGELRKALEGVISAFKQLSRTSADVVTSARTHLQDAVPITYGQIFGAYAAMLTKALRRLEGAADQLRYLNIGGTAAGTGVNSHPEYASRMAEKLSELTRLSLEKGMDLVECSQSTADMAAYSAALKLLALDLSKISNDLRLYSSGPKTGLAEIELPAVQPGSSIMPGKVNPVICECLNMVSFQVIGNDSAVSWASQAAQFQLNVMMPVIIFNILFSMKILIEMLNVFKEKCLDGIRVDRNRAQHYFENSMGLATILNPMIGYSAAADVVKEALKNDQSIIQTLKAKKILSDAEFKKRFAIDRITQPKLTERPSSK